MVPLPIDTVERVVQSNNVQQEIARCYVWLIKLVSKQGHKQAAQSSEHTDSFHFASRSHTDHRIRRGFVVVELVAGPPSKRTYITCESKLLPECTVTIAVLFHRSFGRRDRLHHYWHAFDTAVHREISRKPVFPNCPRIGEGGTKQAARPGEKTQFMQRKMYHYVLNHLTRSVTSKQRCAGCTLITHLWRHIHGDCQFSVTSCAR